MSILHLRIELPAYSHSFNIDIPTESTIHQVKAEISKACPGQPKIEGQRLICRGRNLADEETVGNLWKSSTDSHTLHLAVHPSAWTGQPPDVPTSATPTMQSGFLAPAPPQMTTPLGQASWRPMPPSGMPFYPSYRPIPYIAMKHQNALKALMGTPPTDDTMDEGLRGSAKLSIERVGWTWPAVFDVPYPAYQAGGLVYEPTVINGQQYLSLKNADDAPTAIQKHALAILSYTFTLMNLSVTFTSLPNRPATPTATIPGDLPQVNQMLRRFGMPQLVAPDGQNAEAPRQWLQQDGRQVRLEDVPLRPLLMPLFMLLIRTVLLLYFVAPARKPVFAVLILTWMLYEIWRPLRRIRFRVLRGNFNGDVQQNHVRNPNFNQGFPGMMNNDGNAGQQPAAGGGGPMGLGAPNLDAQAAAVLDTLANLNLRDQQVVLDQAHLYPVAEPGLGSKIASFFGLLFATLHPAVWNRRRMTLRRREGVIRTEANMRRQPPPREDGQEETEEERRAAETRQHLREQHARRPQWVQQYMERVLAEEWVDDLD